VVADVEGVAAGRWLAGRRHLPLAAALLTTALISAGADPTDVQKTLRHANLRTTLETYVRWWPKKEHRRNVVGSALRAAEAREQDEA
jgi:integrase